MTVVGAGIASDAVNIQIAEDEIEAGGDAQAVQLPMTSNNLASHPAKGRRIPPPMHYRQN